MSLMRLLCLSLFFSLFLGLDVLRAQDSNVTERPQVSSPVADKIDQISADGRHLATIQRAQKRALHDEINGIKREPWQPTPPKHLSPNETELWMLRDYLSILREVTELHPKDRDARLQLVYRLKRHGDVPPIPHPKPWYKWYVNKSQLRQIKRASTKGNVAASVLLMRLMLCNFCPSGNEDISTAEVLIKFPIYLAKDLIRTNKLKAYFKREQKNARRRIRTTERKIKKLESLLAANK